MSHSTPTSINGVNAVHELAVPAPKHALAEEENSCSICHDPIDTRAMCVPCKHEYCLSCIATWLNPHRSCPLCRVRVITLVISDSAYEHFTPALLRKVIDITGPSPPAVPPRARASVLQPMTHVGPTLQYLIDGLNQGLPVDSLMVGLNAGHGAGPVDLPRPDVNVMIRIMNDMQDEEGEDEDEDEDSSSENTVSYHDESDDDDERFLMGVGPTMHASEQLMEDARDITASLQTQFEAMNDLCRRVVAINQRRLSRLDASPPPLHRPGDVPDAPFQAEGATVPVSPALSARELRYRRRGARRRLPFEDDEFVASFHEPYVARTSGPSASGRFTEVWSAPRGIDVHNNRSHRMRARQRQPAEEADEGPQ